MRETAKRLVVLSGVLVSVVSAASVPALAQEEVSATGAAQYEAGPMVEEVSATFELAVEGEAPEGAAFFGYLDKGEPFPVALADPDGDGVYVGSYEHVGMGDSLGATIVRGTWSREDLAVGASPSGPASTIRDFGLVTFDGDRTLSASVSFADDEDEPAAPAEPAADPAESTTPVAEGPAGPVEEGVSPAPVFVGVDGGDAAEEGGEEADQNAGPSEESADEERALPNTGGAALLMIGAGALVTAAGLLLRRITG